MRAMLWLLMCLSVAGPTLLGGGGPASAADRFVSTAGSDAANDCLSASSPCATPAQALSQAVSGDTINVAGGDYEELALTIHSSDTLAFVGGWSEDFGSRDTVAHSTTLRSNGTDFNSSAHIFDLEAGSGVVIAVTVDGFRLVDAVAYGGAMRVVSTEDGALTLHVTDSVFENNAGNAGGMFAISALNSSMTIDASGSTFTRGRGGTGGIRLLAGQTSALSLTVTNSVFSKNPADLVGGGVLVEHLSTGPMTVDITGCTFARNRTHQGGGLWINAGPTASVTVTNSTFTSNRAVEGGGIWAEGGFELNVVNSTIARNRAQPVDVLPDHGVGGGVLLQGSVTATLRNTILARNRGRQPGADLWVREDAPTLTVNADHSDIMNPLIVSGTFNDVGGNITARPRFAASMTGLHEAPTSPTIDAGTCTGAPATDFEGDPRPSGADCDIGADEFVP